MEWYETEQMGMTVFDHFLVIDKGGLQKDLIVASFKIYIFSIVKMNKMRLASSVQVRQYSKAIFLQEVPHRVEVHQRTPGWSSASPTCGGCSLRQVLISQSDFRELLGSVWKPLEVLGEETREERLLSTGGSGKRCIRSARTSWVPSGRGRCPQYSRSVQKNINLS